MRRALLAALATVLVCALALAAVRWGLEAAMPDYPAALSAQAAEEKITGMWLTEQAAEQDNSLLIFGSSELKTTDICTHPANFFADTGLQVDLIGRGSCQSIIHAMAIGAQGEALRGRQIVLITAPQSYVPEGIASDLFMANYSQQQLLDILGDETIPDDIKTYLSARTQALFDAYEADTGLTPEAYTAGDLLSAAWAEDGAAALLEPYGAAAEWLLDTRDLAEAKDLAEDFPDEAPAALNLAFDWDAELEAALDQAAEMVTNNDFYMQDSYYATYIGAKLDQQAGKDAALSYETSPEYGDLRCLLDLCSLWDLEVLFVHVPMHGAWNDFTGFDAGRRAAYYQAVRDIAEDYDNVTLLDLTGYEYEPYFLCDTMHLGWKGWLAVDRAIVEFYHAA